MLVEVPAPPWITSTTNWSCHWPATSLQAATMASARCVEQAQLLVGLAAACLIWAKARIRSG
jgi:hypothetical protein